MRKTISWRQRLQPHFDEPHVKPRTCRVPHTFDKAHHWVQDRLSPQTLATYLVMFGMRQGQPISPPKRLIGARRGVTTRTVFNHTDEMVKARTMRIVRRRIPGRNRHYTNIYIFLDHEGNDLKPPVEQNFHEKKRQILKPSTTTPREVSRVDSNIRLRWEHNRFHNHPPAMRRLYEENGALWAKIRLLQKRRGATGPSEKADFGVCNTGPGMGEEEIEMIRARLSAKMEA